MICYHINWCRISSINRTLKNELGGGFKYFYVHCYCDSQSDEHIFQMGGSTTNQMDHKLDDLMMTFTGSFRNNFESLDDVSILLRVVSTHLYDTPFRLGGLLAHVNELIPTLESASLDGKTG